MDKKDVLNKLNWFYSLEVAQVDNYAAQSRMIKDKYISLAMDRFADIELQHIYNISAHIKNLGAQPSKTADFAATNLGRLMGSITPSAGLANMLQINIMVENKAKKDYRKFIDQVEDPELLQTLWANFVDEDLHTIWMMDRVNHLKADSQKIKLRL